MDLKGLLQSILKKNNFVEIDAHFLRRKMRQVTIYTTDREYNQFIELAKNLRYVKKIETDDLNRKAAIVKNVKKGFEEMKLIKEGKLKTTSLKDFLDEL